MLGCALPQGDDEGPWCIDLSVRPVFDPRTKGYKIPPLSAQPALPLEFRDSAEAVKALARQGADFLSGDGHMTLSTKVLPNGTAVWHTTIWDKPYETPFA